MQSISVVLLPAATRIMAIVVPMPIYAVSDAVLNVGKCFMFKQRVLWSKVRSVWTQVHKDVAMQFSLAVMVWS
eukprot:1527243-Amphidinium_carterae.1